jgi:hypothetical protein
MGKHPPTPSQTLSVWRRYRANGLPGHRLQAPTPPSCPLRWTASPGHEILRVLRATARATNQTAERADVVHSVFVAPKDLSGNGESAEGQFSGPI